LKLYRKTVNNTQVYQLGRHEHAARFPSKKPSPVLQVRNLFTHYSGKNGKQWSPCSVFLLP